MPVLDAARGDAVTRTFIEVMAAALIAHIEDPGTNATPYKLAAMREEAESLDDEKTRARILAIIEIAEKHFGEAIE